MALEVACGSITVTTGAVNTTFTVSGLSFQPKAILFSCAGRATVGGAEADLFPCMGIAVSTSSRRAYAFQSDHGNSTASATDNVWYNDCVIAKLTVAGAADGKCDLDAITSDGFRIVIDAVFGQALVVGWIAWGGDDLTGAEIVDFTDPAGTGNQDYSTSFALDTGIDDKAVIIIGAGRADAGTPATGDFMMFGACVGDTPSNAVLAGSSVDGAGTSVTCSYVYGGECIGVADNNAVVARASLTTWLSTGFRLSWAEVYATDTLRFSALVLKGGRWEGGNIVTATDTNAVDEATTYVPKGLLFASANRGVSTQDTTSSIHAFMLGAATGPAARWVALVQDKNNAATSDCFCYQGDAAFYANASTATTQAIEGLGDLVDLVPGSGNGFTWVMDDADPAGVLVTYISCADAPATVYDETGLQVTATAVVALTDVQRYKDLGLSVPLLAVVAATDLQHYQEMGLAVPVTALVEAAEAQHYLETGLAIPVTGVVEAADAKKFDERGLQITAVGVVAATDIQHFQDLGLQVTAQGTVTVTEALHALDLGLPVTIVGAATVTDVQHYQETLLAVSVTAVLDQAVAQHYKEIGLQITAQAEAILADVQHYKDLGLSIPISALIAVTESTAGGEVLAIVAVASTQVTDLQHYLEMQLPATAQAVLAATETAHYADTLQVLLAATLQATDVEHWGETLEALAAGVVQVVEAQHYRDMGLLVEAAATWAVTDVLRPSRLTVPDVIFAVPAIPRVLMAPRIARVLAVPAQPRVFFVH